MEFAFWMVLIWIYIQILHKCSISTRPTIVEATRTKIELSISILPHECSKLPQNVPDDNMATCVLLTIAPMCQETCFSSRSVDDT